MASAKKSLSMEILPGTFAVLKFPPGEALPEWSLRGTFFNVTWAEDEISLVTQTENVPATLKPVIEWRVLKLQGPFAFDETGILLAVIEPLERAHVGIFAISTYDTDYVLVNSKDLQATISALRAADHRVTGN